MKKIRNYASIPEGKIMLDKAQSFIISVSFLPIHDHDIDQ